MENVYIGFDFSMNKPAATIYYDGKFYFYFWPLDLSDTKIEKYHDCGVFVRSRGLPSITTKKGQNSQLVLIHTIRSTELANYIISDIDDLIHERFNLNDGDYELYVCSEGLSYASKGDATLNLATYKGVLLSKIYEHYGDSLKRMFTYSPITLKATAGCSKKQQRGDKGAMIDAFCNEPLISKFKDGIEKKILVAKTNYIEGVDDLVDSYWAIRTMIIKEKLPFKYSEETETI